MMKVYLFVGEKPSETAHRQGWNWNSGRLAAKTLFDALDAAGINRNYVGFLNLFGDHPDDEEALTRKARGRLNEIRHRAEKQGTIIVAMGKKVARHLELSGVPHVAIRHPAARGAGRAKDVYAKHVADALVIG